MVKQAQQEAAKRLKDLLADGDIVYTIIRYVSKSGMTRHISLLTFKDGQPRYLTYNAGLALGRRIVEKNGYNAVVVSGCGMGMGFEVVYALSQTLGITLNQQWL